ncbi:class I adenylate-forming enzyme family protein [Nocardia sp. NPDC058518]|uniref:class I adenylate-forming enzyme family protein n=1 Tax=Nocardia sp. NPDC058518 TaxID=3346534 RepID=UPI00365EE67D
MDNDPTTHDRGPFSILAAAASAAGTSTAVRDGDRTVTYAQLLRAAVGAAGTLAESGVRQGDRVVVRAATTPETIALLFGVWHLGATAVPLHPATTDLRLDTVVRDCSAALVVDDGSNLGAIDDDTETPELPVTGHGPADLVCLMYTSGSTAAPKGVRCPAAAVDAAMTGIAQRLGYRADDRVAMLLPLSFDYGLYQVLLTFAARGELVLADGSSPGAMLQAIYSHEVTVLPLVPAVATMLSALMARRGPAPAVRSVTSTGADLAEHRISELRTAFPSAAMIAMYGITECKRVSIAEADAGLTRPGTVGRPLAGTSVEIVDESGAPLPADTVGQIVAYGPHVMDGYWGPPDLSDGVFGTTEDGRRFLRTGDYGRVDADGYLYIQGRRDDIFKVKGVRTSTAEIAAAAEQVPGVGQAVTVPPTPDSPYLVVITGTVEPAVVLAGMARHLEPQKIPDDCVVVSALPLTSNGKIDVRNVIRQYQGKE